MHIHEVNGNHRRRSIEGKVYQSQRRGRVERERKEIEGNRLKEGNRQIIRRKRGERIEGERKRYQGNVENRQLGQQE